MSDKLKKIRSGGVQRALSLAKMSLSGAAKAGWQQVSNPFLKPSERKKAWEEYLLSQAQTLTAEMSRLKGSLMKAGQMLSLYGERILPPEVNQVLRTLQSQSLALEWEAIEHELIRELGPEKLRELSIDPEPVGMASLGQVHSAVVGATGQRIALKVRYPGIDEAIESDLKWLSGLLRMSRFVPFTPALDQVFEEARRMLHQEVDYVKERARTEKYWQCLNGDDRFIVPRPVGNYCSGQVLATSFEDGLTLEDDQITALSEERRNRLGFHFMELYLRELFDFKMVQTDSHFGNFRIRLDPNGVRDQWVLYDFGAVRELDDAFVARYRALLRASVNADRLAARKALVDLGMLDPHDASDYGEHLVSLCMVGTEPIRFQGEYDWGRSDLAERAAQYIPRLAFRRELRLPPPEMISLDRKSAGVFFMLSKLRVKLDASELVQRYLSD